MAASFSVQRSLLNAGNLPDPHNRVRCYTAAMRDNNKNDLCFLVLLLATIWLPTQAVNAQDARPSLVLVTLDGVRWQEVFGGIDSSMIEDERYTDSPGLMKATYWHEQRDERRKKLFPFLWSTVASQGVMIGDREQGSYMEVTNPWWFSYPGYNEILTGRADPAIDSNDKNWNSNVTFLEVLNGMAEFKDSVFAFGSWDVFPYIFNTERSGLPVNAGFDIAVNVMTERTRWLNEVSAEAPKLWSTPRRESAPDAKASARRLISFCSDSSFRRIFNTTSTPARLTGIVIAVFGGRAANIVNDPQ